MFLFETYLMTFLLKFPVFALFSPFPRLAIYLAFSIIRKILWSVLRLGLDCCTKLLKLSLLTVDKNQKKVDKSIKMPIFDRMVHAKPIFAVFLAISVSVNLAAGTDHADSLRAEHLCSAAMTYFKEARDSTAMENAVCAEEIARARGWSHPLALALLIKARICSLAQTSPDFNRNDEALAYLEEASGLALSGTDKSLIARIYFVTSEIYVNKNRWNNPLDSALLANAKYFLALGDELAQTPQDIFLSVCSHIRLHRSLGEYDKAIQYCKDALGRISDTDYVTKSGIYDQLFVLRELKREKEKKQYLVFGIPLLIALLLFVLKLLFFRHKHFRRKEGLPSASDNPIAIRAGLESGSSEKENVCDDFMLRLSSIVDAHIEENRSNVAEIAEEMCMSPYQLRIKVLSRTGMTPKAYITSLKLSRAGKMILELPDVSIMEIAFRCGFSDHHYFSRLFKKTYGMTPSDFRSGKALQGSVSESQ